MEEDHRIQSSPHLGDEVSFFIPQCEPSKYGYDFRYFEASPYRDGERMQPFNRSDLEDGFHVSFICSKKRHSFSLIANWMRVRPFQCTLEVHQNLQYFHSKFFVIAYSEVDEEGKDYVDFSVSDINDRLHNEVIDHATLIDNDAQVGMKTEWGPDELRDSMCIRIPCADDRSTFAIMIKTRASTGRKKGDIKVKKQKHESVNPPSNHFEQDPPDFCSFDAAQSLSAIFGDDNPPITESNHSISLPDCEISDYKADSAGDSFTPGCIYESGGKFYGIYKRLPPERDNTYGKVDVAEVDHLGRKITNLEWRHVYKTKGGKEYIYGLSNREWKIYTKCILTGIPLDRMERYGMKKNWPLS